MSDQDNLKDYTALDDFFQVINNFAGFSSDSESLTYHSEKIERKHLLLLLAWPGIFTIRLASILGKDEFKKEFEFIEALHSEDKIVLYNYLIKIETDKILQKIEHAIELIDEDKEKVSSDNLTAYIDIKTKIESLEEEIKRGLDNERNIFKKTLHTTAKLFKDEKDKDLRLENIRERFKELDVEYWLEKLGNFIKKHDKKFDKKKFDGKIENLTNLFKELYERYDKKYRNQIVKLRNKWVDIIDDKDEHQLTKYFEEVNKFWIKLSKELLNQISKISDEKRLEKRVLTLTVELIGQCLKLLKSLSEKITDGLDSEDLNADYIKNLIDEQKIMIDGQIIDSTWTPEHLLFLLFKEDLFLAHEKIKKRQVEKKPLFEKELKKYFKKYAFYSIPKSIRKISLIFLHIKHIDKQNIDELYDLFSNYFIIFYLFVYFFKDETEPIYISLDEIKISNLKDKTISFDPAKKGRYVRIADSDLKEIIENSNIETFGRLWLGLTNDLVIDKVNRFRTHNKETTHLSTNHIPSENLYWTQEDLFLHHIKTKESSNFGIVNDKSEFDNNIDYQ